MENSDPNKTGAQAQPPGGGRQDHDVMRAAAQRQIVGPGGTDHLAAVGALDVPGGEPHPELTRAASDAPGPVSPREPIPGEYDRSTLTHREPGTMGGKFAGADVPPPDPHWVDDRTAQEHKWEGGGQTPTSSKPR